MKPLLQNKNIAGKKIGDWIAHNLPDGTILWTKKKKLFHKSSLLGVYATPHYDKLNVVSVDVTLHKDNDITLSTSFHLKGEFLESDLKTYIVQMTTILSMLK